MLSLYSPLGDSGFRVLHIFKVGFPDSSVGKESACNAGDPGLIPGLERPPGEGKDHPLQCSGLENSMDCLVHGVAESQTRLSDDHFHFFRVIWEVSIGRACYLVNPPVNHCVL